MFDARLRRVVDPAANALATCLARVRLSADAVTAGGFILGVAAWACLAFEWYVPALAFIVANRIADGLDGALARRNGPTDLGGFLDIVLDFVFYAGVPFFFAVGRPEFALPAAFLVFAFVGTGSSFLAFAAIAAKRGLATEARGRKAIYYLGGLTEGAETIALFVLICLWPDGFAMCAWIFGGICFLTTALRIAEGVTTFRDRA